MAGDIGSNRERSRGWYRAKERVIARATSGGGKRTRKANKMTITVRGGKVVMQEISLLTAWAKCQ